MTIKKTGPTIMHHSRIHPKIRAAFQSGATILCFLFFHSGFSDGYDWKAIEIADTLDVFLGKSIIGDIIHSVVYNENTKRTSVTTVMSIGEAPGAGGRMNVRESRIYDFSGAMVSAYQEMEGQSGINSWGLKKISDGWELCVIVGGKKTDRKIPDVGDNLSSECFLHEHMKNKALKKGDTWNDTAFELMSAQPVVTKILCSNVDTVKHQWKFENTDNISGRKETLVMDENGKTLEQSIEGIFVAKRRTISPPKGNPGTSADSGTSKSAPGKTFQTLTEMFSVPADAACPPDKVPAIILTDSTVSLDTSVKDMYRRQGLCWMLLKQATACTPQKESTPDKGLLKWLEPTVTLQSDQPKIIALAKQLRGDEKNTCAIISKFNNYVFSHLQKRNTPVFSNALETLNAGYGDCGEHSALLAALLRAAGVPARVALGLLYIDSKKQYFYHAQVMAYSGKWIFCDPTWNEFPSFGRFVPLIIDDTGSGAMLLSRLIGRIQIHFMKPE
jgi:hypothetical protein